jgi:hypothetical protein
LATKPSSDMAMSAIRMVIGCSLMDVGVWSMTVLTFVEWGTRDIGQVADLRADWADRGVAG